MNLLITNSKKLTILKFQVQKPKEEFPAQILTDSEIKAEKIHTEEDDILINLQAVRAELEGLKQQRDEDNEKIVIDIVDPGYGNVIDDKFYSDDIRSSTETTDKPFKVPKIETPVLKPEKIEIDDLFISILKRIPEIINEPTNDTLSYLPSGLEQAIGEMSTDDALATIKKSRNSSQQSSNLPSGLEDALGNISTDNALGKKPTLKKSRDSSRQSSNLPSGLVDALEDISTDDALGKKSITKKSRDSSRQSSNLPSGLEDALGDISTDDTLGKINDGGGLDKDLLDVINNMTSDRDLTQSEEEKLLATTDDGLIKNVTNESEYNSDRKRVNSPIDMYISDDDMFITLPKNEDSKLSRTTFMSDKDDMNIINDLSDSYVIPDPDLKSYIKIRKVDDEVGVLPDFPDRDNIFTKSPDQKITKHKLPSFRYRSVPYEKPKLSGLMMSRDNKSAS